MEEFKESDHRMGYFCYNCVYFIKPNHCAIVIDKGPDVYGKTSGQIAPYGICAETHLHEQKVKLSCLPELYYMNNEIKVRLHLMYIEMHS